MFHAMAEASRSPWFHLPWDIARSQSNLRVSTTGKTRGNTYFVCHNIGYYILNADEFVFIRSLEMLSPLEYRVRVINIGIISSIISITVMII